MWLAGMPSEERVLVELTGFLTWKRRERSPRLTLSREPVVLHPNEELEMD
jgi:hypothetical protein